MVGEPLQSLQTYCYQQALVFEKPWLMVASGVEGTLRPRSWCEPVVLLQSRLWICDLVRASRDQPLPGWVTVMGGFILCDLYGVVVLFGCKPQYIRVSSIRKCCINEISTETQKHGWSVVWFGWLHVMFSGIYHCGWWTKSLTYLLMADYQVVTSLGRGHESGKTHLADCKPATANLRMSKSALTSVIQRGLTIWVWLIWYCSKLAMADSLVFSCCFHCHANQLALSTTLAGWFLRIVVITAGAKGVL